MTGFHHDFAKNGVATVRYTPPTGVLQCAAVLILVALAGCDGAPYTLAPVRGQVLLDGEPLTHGTISFIPEAGPAAGGQIQPDGTFVLETPGYGEGATVGQHEIAISTAEISYGPAEDDQRPAHGLLPREYSNPTTSGLTFEVGPGENLAHFPLNRKGPERDPP